VLRQAGIYPDLFVPFAHFSLGNEGPARVDELARSGFRGLRVWAPPAPYDDARFFPVYEAAEALEMPLLFHTGYLPLTPLDRALDVRSERMRPVYLDTLGRYFPRLSIIGVSFGYPWCEEAFETLRHHPNVFFDLSGEILRKKDSAFFRTMFRAEKELALEESRPASVWSRVLFGSGVRHEQIASVERNYQRLFRALALDDGTQEAIMGGTARRLLSL